jgi:hypothetical protein
LSDELPVQIPGIWWPSADPGKLRTAAQAWDALRMTIDDVAGDAQRSVERLGSENSGQVVDAVKTYWDQYWGGDGGDLAKASSYCAQLRDALNKYAAEVDHARHQVTVLVEEALGGLALGVVVGALTAGAGIALEGAGLTVLIEETFGVSEAVAAFVVEVGANVLVDLSLRLLDDGLHAYGKDLGLSSAESLVDHGVDLVIGKVSPGDDLSHLNAMKVGGGAALGAALGAGEVLIPALLSKSKLGVPDPNLSSSFGDAPAAPDFAADLTAPTAPAAPAAGPANGSAGADPSAGSRVTAPQFSIGEPLPAPTSFGATPPPPPSPPPVPVPTGRAATPMGETSAPASPATGDGAASAAAVTVNQVTIVDSGSGPLDVSVGAPAPAAPLDPVVGGTASSGGAPTIAVGGVIASPSPAGFGGAGLGAAATTPAPPPATPSGAPANATATRPVGTPSAPAPSSTATGPGGSITAPVEEPKPVALPGEPVTPPVGAAAGPAPAPAVGAKGGDVAPPVHASGGGESAMMAPMVGGGMGAGSTSPAPPPKRRRRQRP